MNKLSVAIIQYAPTYGELEKNLHRHFEIIKKAAKEGRELVIFPELSLTGYFLRDLTHRLMMSADELETHFNKSMKGKKLPDVVVGFVEKGESHNPYNSFAYLAHSAKGYAITHVHRKCFLPTYGMFEDARFFAPGRNFGVFPTKFGKIGMLLCEDAWHPMSFYVEALKGAEIIIVGSASPARGIGGARPHNLAHWDALNTMAASTWSCYVLYASRTGVEDSVVFSGGSAVFSPAGDKVAELPEISVPKQQHESLEYTVRKSEIMRGREVTPLLRGENLALFSNEIENLKRNYYHGA